MEIAELVELLIDKDNQKAYESLLQLEKQSENSSNVYFYFDTFLEMLKSDKMLIRIRGFRLICKNAKWDTENKIDSIIDMLLQELEGEKPIAVRQCLQALREMVFYKKQLQEVVQEKIVSINYLNYPASMQTLILQDTEKVLEIIKQNT